MIYCKKAPSKQYKNRPESLWLWSKPYDELFVAAIREFPMRHYHKDLKMWEVPLSYFSDIVKKFPNISFYGEIEEERVRNFSSLQEYEEYLKTLTIQADYQPKTPMDPWQIEFFNEMLKRDRVLNADPMGLGKTKEYLDVCEYRKIARGYRKILFICGAKYKYNMLRQIKIHTNSTATVVDGPREKRLQQMRDFYYNDDYYLIIGYEAAANHREELKKLADNLIFDGVIIDESQKIKNFEVRKNVSEQKKHLTVKIVNLIEYIDPELLIMGTGTPVGKKAEDLYSTLRLMKVETRDIWSFKNRYCIFDHWGRITGYKNLQELSQKLQSIMIRRPKGLLHLKEPRPEYVALEMHPKQAAFYNSCLLQLREELKGTKAITASQMTKILRLRQITSNPMLVGSDAPSIKEEVVLEMVKNMVANEEKVIIFSIYVEEVLRLVELLKEFNPAHVVGSMSSKKAQAEVDRFQEDPNCWVMVGSIHACKESYDMYAASNVILLDMSYNVNDNEQAITRAWRRGQQNTVNIYYLYCENTVDEHVLEILVNDKDLIDQLVGAEDKSVQVFRKDLVYKLLGIEGSDEHGN